MQELSANLKGEVVGFMEKGIVAVVKTEFGFALLDINVSFDWKLQIGDEVEIEDGGAYIENGQIVTTAPEERITHEEQRGDHKYYRLVGD